MAVPNSFFTGKFSEHFQGSGKSKWGHSKWWLKVLHCPRLPAIVVIWLRQLDDCAQIAERGLKAPFESPPFILSRKGQNGVAG